MGKVSLSLMIFCIFVFFFNDTATTEIYTLSLHDALPIYKYSGVTGVIFPKFTFKYGVIHVHHKNVGMIQ